MRSNSRQESLRCPKCGAGRSALYLAHRYLESGQQLQEIACRICACVLASREVWLTRMPVPAPGRKAPQGRLVNNVPCAVVGCDKKHSGQARLPLCGKHNHRLHGWQQGKKHIVPPPVSYTNGVWIPRESTVIPGVRL